MATLTRQIQEALKTKGFDPGPIDGMMGPKTEAAIIAFKKSRGLAARPYVGPITLEKLGLPTGPVADELPWMAEATKYMGYHEITNNLALRKFLKSDGATLGDPAKLPWCGDFVETCIKLTLPNEPFIGKLAVNPYWALNWAEFGEASVAKYGALGVFKRTGGGHVGFLVGQDTAKNRWRVRGGNQANSVSDTWIGGGGVTLVAIRKPVTWRQDLPDIPMMDAKGNIVSSGDLS